MVSIIVAFDKNRVIGINNKLPWHFKEDLAYFKEVTMGHDLLMGRLTFESILSYQNKPLPGRHHFVATRKASYDFKEVTTISDVDDFIETYPVEKELFVIGGAKIYHQLVDKVDRLYVTHVHDEFTGDAWFPEVDFDQWAVVCRKNSEKLSFVVYERK